MSNLEQKLEAVEKRFIEVTAELGKPEVVSDHAQIQSLAKLRAELEPDLAPVTADIGLMERVLENLIENALTFTPRGGSVTVELRDDSHRVEVCVADTGCGALRRVDQDGNVTTVGPVASTTEVLLNGVSPSDFFRNGTCVCSLDFTAPEGVSVDFMGNIYVSEPDQGAVWMVQPSGNVVLAAPG